MRDDNELRESGGTSGQMAQGAGEDWKAPGNGGDKGPESRCGEAEGSRGCGDPQGHRGLKQGTGSRHCSSPPGHAGHLEPPERPQGSPAPSSDWREDPVGSITTNKARGGDGIPVELLQIPVELGGASRNSTGFGTTRISGSLLCGTREVSFPACGEGSALSHPYMTTGKTIALTRRTFVGKVTSLLFNMCVCVYCLMNSCEWNC